MIESDSETIKNAIEFAKAKHSGQKYDRKPYIYHLGQVVKILSEFGYQSNTTVICTGWLHDTLEDTETTKEELEKAFGTPVAYAVWTVTSEGGTNRMSRLQSIVQKLRSSDIGLTVKLADRIANTEECKLNNLKLFKAYVAENEYLKELFCKPKTAPHLMPLWERLALANTPPIKITKSHVH